MAHSETIVFIGHGASRTGAPMSLLNIIKWFSINTDHACVVVLGNGGPLVEEYSKYADVHLWNKNKHASRNVKNLWYSLIKRLGRSENPLLNRHQASVIEALTKNNVVAIFNNTGVNGHILEALKFSTNAPAISRIPELEAYMRKNNRNGSIDRILALSDHFIAVSRAVKKNLIDSHAIRPERISVIYGACGTQRLDRGGAKLREKLGLDKNAFIVGACGTMDYRKGVDLFIQVANHSINKLGSPDVFFCWIGASVSHDSGIELQCEVEQLSLNGRFFFIGEVAETAAYLADLDLFLLTSREDPFPLAMLEAARQAVPIVCFEGGGGAPEFVDDAIGSKVPMLDVAGMSLAVEHLGKKPELRARLGTAAHEKSLAYSPDRMGHDIHEVLMKVREIAGKGRLSGPNEARKS